MFYSLPFKWYVGIIVHFFYPSIFLDGNPGASSYRMTGRNFNCDMGNPRIPFHSEPVHEDYEGIQDRRNYNDHAMEDRSSAPNTSRLNHLDMMPTSDDVKTIARQMRTMPNYFAAMAAAASINAYYPNSTLEQDTDSGYPSSRNAQMKEMSNFQSSEYATGNRYNKQNGTDTSLRQDRSMEEKRETPLRQTSQVEMYAELQDMVSYVFTFENKDDCNQI